MFWGVFKCARAGQRVLAAPLLLTYPPPLPPSSSSLLPPFSLSSQVLDQERVRQQFNLALDAMNTAVEGKVPAAAAAGGERAGRGRKESGIQ